MDSYGPEINDGELGLSSFNPRRIDQPETPAKEQPCFVSCSFFKITLDRLSNPGQFTNASHAIPSSLPYTPLIASLIQSQLILT